MAHLNGLALPRPGNLMADIFRLTDVVALRNRARPYRRNFGLGKPPENNGLETYIFCACWAANPFAKNST